MPIVTTQKGFTLIEVIVYIALFTIVIGGAIMTSTQIFQGSERVQRVAAEETEINFMLRKIDWLVSGGSIVSPTPGNTASSLTVLKDGNVYVLTLNSGVLELDGVPVTDEILNITAMSFEVIDDTPDILETSITVNGRTLDTQKRYVRKN